MFGKEILVGTAIVNSLLKYLQDSSAYLEESGEETVEEKKVEEITDQEGNEKETKEEVVDPNDIGIDNVALEGDGVAMDGTGSRKPSLKPSLAGSRRGSKAPSLALSKAVSFAPGSKPPSCRVTPAKSLGKGNKVHTPLKGTPNKLNSTHKSIASRRRSTNPNMHATPSHRSRRDSVASFGQSSQIHYYIVSNPGLTSDTPLKKIFTPKKSSRHSSRQSSTSKKKKDQTKIGNPDVAKVTPFKALMEKPASPSPAKSMKESTPLLTEEPIEWDDPFEVKESPRRRSLVEQITTPIKQLATPIKSVGSKLISPVHSFRGSQSNTPNRVSSKPPSRAPSGSGSKASSRRVSQTGSLQVSIKQSSSKPPTPLRTPVRSNENVESDELEIGAEAADFAEFRSPVRGEGDGAEEHELGYMDEQTEDEDGEEPADGQQVEESGEQPEEEEKAEEQTAEGEAPAPPIPPLEDGRRQYISQ